MKIRINNFKSKVSLLLASMITSPVMASGGGLTKATAVATDFKAELYGFLGVIVFIYVMYHVIRAKMGKEQWADVLEALGHVAIAGGVLAAVTFAWNVWA